ncbi:MAG: hypothetical protein JWM11_3854, partial [Planctomycetaceae bacterium]|nr:hypothetical protein [Planctomycetaceae bacterium]
LRRKLWATPHAYTFRSRNEDIAIEHSPGECRALLATTYIYIFLPCRIVKVYSADQMTSLLSYGHRSSISWRRCRRPSPSGRRSLSTQLLNNQESCSIMECVSTLSLTRMKMSHSERLSRLANVTDAPARSIAPLPKSKNIGSSLLPTACRGDFPTRQTWGSDTPQDSCRLPSMSMVVMEMGMSIATVVAPKSSNANSDAVRSISWRTIVSTIATIPTVPVTSITAVPSIAPVSSIIRVTVTRASVNRPSVAEYLGARAAAESQQQPHYQHSTHQSLHCCLLCSSFLKRPCGSSWGQHQVASDSDDPQTQSPSQNSKKASTFDKRFKFATESSDASRLNTKAQSN